MNKLTTTLLDIKFKINEIGTKIIRPANIFVKGLLKNEELPTRVFSEPLQKLIS